MAFDFIGFSRNFIVWNENHATGDRPYDKWALSIYWHLFIDFPTFHRLRWESRGRPHNRYKLSIVWRSLTDFIDFYIELTDWWENSANTLTAGGDLSTSKQIDLLTFINWFYRFFCRADRLRSESREYLVNFETSQQKRVTSLLKIIDRLFPRVDRLRWGSR